MASATFYDMKLLCYIDDSDFTDYQGIGSDPLYKRYDSVMGVVKNYIDPKYQNFLARPHYDDGIINWYVHEWQEPPMCFTQLEGEEKEKYVRIKEETLKHYKKQMQLMPADDYTIMASALKYVLDEFIYCYDDQVVVVAWGMRPDTTKHVVEGSWIKGLKINDRFKIVFKCGGHAQLEMPMGCTIFRNKDYALMPRDIPQVKVDEGYIFTGWSPEPLQHVVVDDCVFVAQVKADPLAVPPVPPVIPPEPEMVRVTFNAGTDGDIADAAEKTFPKGYILHPEDIPSVIPNKNYRFKEWIPSVNEPLTDDTEFMANYIPETCTLKFDAGVNGVLKGEDTLIRNFGTNILATDIPKVKANKGFRFIGWDVSPLGLLQGDRTFYAKYEPAALPWYRRWWLFFTGKGCLRWLLWLLLFLLLVFLFGWLFKECSCTSYWKDKFDRGDRDREERVDEVRELEQVEGEDGKIRDNNGIIRDIRDEKGNLPDNPVVAPVIGDDGEDPEIIHNEGAPDVVGNRLNIYFEDEDADLNKWAHDFKEAYPSDDYSIIGADPNVRMIQIQIPESERNRVREEINDKIPDQEFFVVDESIIMLKSSGRESEHNNSLRGWHIKAAHLPEAWQITEGSEDVVVAIVDDGIDASHRFFKDRFYKAYNVFTQNNALSVGEGHGTHVAGLAVGINTYYKDGAAGVAPRCKIMPIQVFDNEICTFSSIASGIMYAIHNGADVVNISIGPSFKGLDELPLEQQQQIARNYFKNEERVYRHIFKTAADKNCILVFATGNDNIMSAILPECRMVNQTLNVAAVTPEFKAAGFTNYSAGTNISAPGVAIFSSYPTNDFTSMDGTSMAAPIVTGAVALMKSIKPTLTVQEAIKILNATGQETDQFIPKMVLVDRALQMLKSGDIPADPEQIGGDRPGIGGDRPGIGGNQPGTGDQPATGGDEPATGGDHPFIGGDLPNPPHGGGHEEVNPDRNRDDYNQLKEELRRLKEQRDKLNSQISDIENKLK